MLGASELTNPGGFCEQVIDDSFMLLDFVDRLAEVSCGSLEVLLLDLIIQAGLIKPVKTGRTAF